MEYMIDFFMMKILMPVLFVITFGAIFIWLPLMIYNQIKESNRPTFELVKSDWQCTQGESVKRMIMVGKIMVPEIQHECIQWSKNQ